MAIHKSPLKITFWNCRSFDDKKTESEQTIKGSDIFICVESWYKEAHTEERIPKYPGFVLIRKDRDYAAGGGILIFIRKNLAFSEIENLNISEKTVELCGFKITNIQPEVNILVCYRAPKLLTQKQWDEIFDNLSTQDPWLIAGDFNAYHSDWNCAYINTNGRRLNNSLTNKELFLHNNNTKTHVDTETGSLSNIDLIMSTINIAEKISVEVCNETWGSDHFPIFITLDVSKNPYEKKTFKLKSLNTNWLEVNKFLDDNYNKFLTPDYENLPTLQKYDFLIKIISESVQTNTPRKKFANKKFRNPTPWWDEECNKIRRLRTACFKKWEYTGNLSDLIKYKKKCAEAKRLFKIKKKNSFQKFAESINFNTNPS